MRAPAPPAAISIDDLVDTIDDLIDVVDDAIDAVFEFASGGNADVVAASVSYRLGAGVHVETLQTTRSAGTAAIDLAGNELANLVKGNAGANALNGGGGMDTLTGGGGADRFVFDSPLGAGDVDTVTDFRSGTDKILLDNHVFLDLTVGTPTGSEADRIIYDTNTGALWFDRDGAGTDYAAVQFATLQAGLTLFNSDFIVVD